MEIVERVENSLLKRVEIRFRMNHAGKPTPTRDQMRSAAASLEPGSAASNVIVKQVETRFGQALTSGLALVYESSDALVIEPDYILERHGIDPTESKATSVPEATPSQAEAAPVEEVSEVNTAAVTEEDTGVDE